MRGLDAVRRLAVVGVLVAVPGTIATSAQADAEHGATVERSTPALSDVAVPFRTVATEQAALVERRVEQNGGGPSAGERGAALSAAVREQAVRQARAAAQRLAEQQRRQRLARQREAERRAAEQKVARERAAARKKLAARAASGSAALDAAIARIPGYGSHRPTRWTLTGRYGHLGATDLANGNIYISPAVSAGLMDSVVRHEWAHVLSVRAYGGDWLGMRAAANRTFGTSGAMGAERLADCMAQQLGATWTHYTSCSSASWRAAASRVLAGRRL